MKTYRITSFLREGIRDNQAVAVTKVIHQLGFTNVSNMRMGKSFIIDAQDDVDIEEIAKELANPVMEDYTIELIYKDKGLKYWFKTIFQKIKRRVKWNFY